MDETKKNEIIEVTAEGVINYAVMNPADVLSGMHLIKPEDIKFLQAHAPEFQERFKNRSIFRSRFEMEFGVLNDDEHPTVDSKYWQAIGEQNVHVSEFINVTNDYKKQCADQEIIEAEIEELQEDLKVMMSDPNTPSYLIKKKNAEIRKKEVDLDQNIFGQANLQKTAQERMKEIKNWEEIIEKLKAQGLEFGDEDFEKHHAKRYALRYANRMQRFNVLEDSAKESVLSHFKSAMTHPENKELAEQIIHNNPLPDVRQPQEQIETKPSNVLPMNSNVNNANSEVHPYTGLPKQDVNFKDIDEMVQGDPIAAKYNSRHVRKILVASPHRGEKDGLVTNLFSMQPPAAFSCELSEPYGLSVADARNFIVKKAIDEGYDYIFFIDDDTLIPRNALVKLIHLKADIAGGFYYRKYYPLESVGMHFDKDGNPSPIEDYKIGDIIHDTLVLPSGCTLIKTEVFKKMEFPWYRTIKRANQPALTEDTYFCEKARMLGYDIITDTGIQCLHVDRERGLLYGHSDIVDPAKNEIKVDYREYFAI